MGVASEPPPSPPVFLVKTTHGVRGTAGQTNRFFISGEHTNDILSSSLQPVVKILSPLQSVVKIKAHLITWWRIGDTFNIQSFIFAIMIGGATSLEIRS